MALKLSFCVLFSSCQEAQVMCCTFALQMVSWQVDTVAMHVGPMEISGSLPSLRSFRETQGAISNFLWLLSPQSCPLTMQSASVCLGLLKLELNTCSLYFGIPQWKVFHIAFSLLVTGHHATTMLLPFLKLSFFLLLRGFCLFGVRNKGAQGKAVLPVSIYFL